MLNGKSILITGGTGSFGHKFTQRVLESYPNIKKIVLFSRDRKKQAEMASSVNDKRVEYLSGDIARIEDTDKACQGIDIIIHTAAMRIVPEAENNPWQCILTNIQGARNLIDCAIKYHIPQILALSTDMASSAHNVYGATKMLSDKLYIAAHQEHPTLKTTVIRYGNMFGSAGTVIPFFIRKVKEEGILPVTDPKMTRFMSTLDECVDIALNALDKSLGGEIIAPKIKSYNILTIAEAIAPQAPINIVGLRPGEKLAEEMVSPYEAYHTIEASDCYVITPTYKDINLYCDHYQGKLVAQDFKFDSENNPWKFSPEDIRVLIKQSKL